MDVRELITSPMPKCKCCQALRHPPQEKGWASLDAFQKAT